MSLGPTFGHWIVELVSCGAKNYANFLNTSEVVCKVRGFSLKFSASQIVNLKSMEKALYAWKNKENFPEMVTVRTMIMHNKLSAVVYTAKIPKQYRVVYNKHLVTDDFTAVPYSY